VRAVQQPSARLYLSMHREPMPQLLLVQELLLQDVTRGGFDATTHIRTALFSPRGSQRVARVSRRQGVAVIALPGSQTAQTHCVAELVDGGGKEPSTTRHLQTPSAGSTPCLAFYYMSEKCSYLSLCLTYFSASILVSLSGTGSPAIYRGPPTASFRSNLYKIQFLRGPRPPDTGSRGPQGTPLTRTLHLSVLFGVASFAETRHET